MKTFTQQLSEAYAIHKEDIEQTIGFLDINSSQNLKHEKIYNVLRKGQNM